MAPRVVVTGVTGYIGGDAFHALYEAHPDFDYTLLVRTKERAESVRGQYGNVDKVKVLYPGEVGPSVSFTEVLEDQAKKADVVLHTADSADDVAQATAILRGLQAAGRSAENPAYWIHISGTGILTWYDHAQSRYGQAPVPEQAYNDLTGIDRLVNLPDQAPHRNVDNIVLSANDNPGIKTAIVAPPTIYGAGRGPVNKSSIALPLLTRFILKHGYAPVIGEGRNEWDNVHVSDVSSLLVRLVDAALDPARKRNPEEIFGGRAYYFCASGTHACGKVAVDIAEEAVRQGLLKEALPKVVSLGEREITDEVGAMWAANSKGVAERARRYLGWEARGPSLEEEIPRVVELEGKKAGVEGKAL
ncbi:uncharacterized protein B0T15DRAFT_488619 [Chaetomium strumarium]|uniref:NAD-dependent epimerase/dehydratase domain-containing protein n=1 Tax=Chaetomium strumarium TaxID=1170767 RepID=A0AAJ0M5K1_9PEZI|nr:hypothetical protein B0T15DRAFT_488619 [Chaetomium strumarium]